MGVGVVGVGGQFAHPAFSRCELAVGLGAQVADLVTSHRSVFFSSERPSGPHLTNADDDDANSYNGRVVVRRHDVILHLEQDGHEGGLARSIVLVNGSMWLSHTKVKAGHTM